MLLSTVQKGFALGANCLQQVTVSFVRKVRVSFINLVPFVQTLMYEP